MKRILAFMTLCAILASCQKEFSISPEKGFLELSSVEALPSVETILTRAMDADLTLEILSATGESLLVFPAGSSSSSGKIELDPGEYLLKAFSSSYGHSASDDEKGDAVYYLQQPFTVQESKTTYLTLEVPMINFGVCLDLPDGFSEAFNSYEFTVSCAGRRVNIQEGETAYFDLPSADALPEYSLSAVNKDDESFSSTLVHSGSLQAGTIYKVRYSLQKESLSL